MLILDLLKLLAKYTECHQQGNIEAQVKKLIKKKKIKLFVLQRKNIWIHTEPKHSLAHT